MEHIYTPFFIAIGIAVFIVILFIIVVKAIKRTVELSKEPDHYKWLKLAVKEDMIRVNWPERVNHSGITYMKVDSNDPDKRLIVFAVTYSVSNKSGFEIVSYDHKMFNEFSLLNEDYIKNKSQS